ncbi:MAG: hypothetical protein GF341_10020 [candidate division Zixibacteria bacterium]|nr:hypothetical protein [candidate division Zixibacteria bacterium]
MSSARNQSFCRWHSVNLIVLACLCVVAVAAVAAAQEAQPSDDQQIYGPRAVGDSMQADIQQRETVPSDTAERYLWESGLFNSPTGKLLRSVVIPGWGQWSNGKKWKAGIFFTIETYFFARALIWRGRTFDRQHVWEESCLDGECDQLLFNTYKSARNNRNYFYWLTGVTVFISMFDAYADAYLLSLERTKDKGDEFWGGHAFLYPEDEYRLLATLTF